MIPFVATVLLVALGIALGQWQQRRAATKIALQQTMTARAADAPLALGTAPLPAAPLEYRRVRLTGHFVKQWPLYLNNRPQEGRGVGFYLVMPFQLDGSDMHVLVARGWLPRTNAAANQPPAVETPDGTVTIEGIVKGSLGRVMQLGTPAPITPGALLQNVEVGQVAQASGLKLQPFFVEQTGPASPDTLLVRDWPAPSLNVAMNEGYAFQWYALATMALLFFIVTGIRRGTN